MANNLQQSNSVVTDSSMAISLAMSSRESVKSSEKRQSEDLETVKIVGTMQALSQMTDTITAESLTKEQEVGSSCSSIYDPNGNGNNNDGDGNDGDDDGDTTSQVISTSNSTTTDEDGNTVTTTSTTTEYTTTTTTTDEDGNVVVTTSSYTEEVTTVVVTDENGTVLSSDTTTEEEEGSTSITTTTINEDGTTTTTYTSQDPYGFSATSSGHGIMGGSSVGLSIASLNHAQDTLLGVDLAWLEQNRLTFQAGTLFAKYEKDDMMDSAEKQRQAGYFEAAQYFASGSAAGVGVGCTMYQSRASLGSLKTSNDEIAQHKKTLALLNKSDTDEVQNRVNAEQHRLEANPDLTESSQLQLEDKARIAAVKHDNNVEAGLDEVFGRGNNTKILTDGEGRALNGNGATLEIPDGSNPPLHLDGEGCMIKQRPDGSASDRIDQDGHRIDAEGYKISDTGVRLEPNQKGNGVAKLTDNELTHLNVKVVTRDEIIRRNVVDGRSIWERNAPTRFGGKAKDPEADVIAEKPTLTKFRDDNFPVAFGGRPSDAPAEGTHLNYNHKKVEDAFGRMDPTEKAALKINTEAKLKAAETKRSDALNQFNANVTWNNMFWSSCVGGILQGVFKVASSEKQKEATEAATWSKYEGSQANQLFSAASNWQSQANTAYQQSLSVLGSTLDALRRATNRS